MTHHEYMLAVDPGLELGWALFPLKGWSRPQRPIAVGELGRQRKKSDPWFIHGLQVVSQISGVLPCRNNQVKEVAIEWPKIFQSAAGQMAAYRGDVEKLAFMAGAIAFQAGLWEAGIKLIPVNDWKGQMKKPIVNRRIQKILGMGFPGHASDAVGIGLYVKGWFDEPNRTTY